MKTGIILYISGEKGLKKALKPKNVAEKLNIRADALEIISKYQGHFDISDAWLSLLQKGASNVQCIFARNDEIGNLELTGRTMRLCG